MKKIKLYCFPYAGGSSVMYNRWKLTIAPFVDLIPIELAGRGKRVYDPLYESVPDAVDDLFNVIKHDLDQPYAIFGHSMGAMMAFELTHKLIDLGFAPPVQLFMSGRGAPHVKREDAITYHLLPFQRFKHEMIKMGGTSPEFFEQPELLKIFFPILRNDLRLAETVACREETIPLPSDITVLVGDTEDLNDSQVKGWYEHTSKTCRIHYIPGDHFFINHQGSDIVQIINNSLCKYL